MASNTTKSYRIKYWIAAAVSFLLTVGPLVGYVIVSIINADLTHEKIALSLSVLVVAILTVIAIVNKINLKSRIWIILLGIYICLGEILIPLIIIAVCQIVDELVVSPLRAHYANKLSINKEIDKREV